MTSYQSSEIAPGRTGPEHAVNGLTFDDPGHVFTVQTPNQWWRVDLEVVHRVYAVILYTESDGKLTKTSFNFGIYLAFLFYLCSHFSYFFKLLFAIIFNAIKL